MIGILNAVKCLIDTKVIAETNVEPIFTGQNKITVDDTSAYQDGDEILIYPADEDGQAFQRQIIVKPNNVLFLSAFIPQDMPNPRIQKMIDGSYIHGVHIGKPNTIPAFPAIALSGQYDTHPLASGGLYERDFDIAIDIIVNAEDYEKRYALMWYYAQRIEQALSQQINPCYPCRQQIFYSEVGPIQEDMRMNREGTLQGLMVSYHVRETVQRLVTDIPVNLAMRQ